MLKEPTVKIESSRVAYQDRWTRVLEHSVEQSGQFQPYAVVERSDSVVVIPLSDDNRLVLLLQDRHPTNERRWELPGGSIDAQESPHAAAIRELQEETKLEVANLIDLGEMRPLPALTPQRVSIFLARVSDDEIEGAYAPDEMDDIVSSTVIRVEDTFRMVQAGEITDGLTLAALLMLKLWLDQQ